MCFMNIVDNRTNGLSKKNCRKLLFLRDNSRNDSSSATSAKPFNSIPGPRRVLLLGHLHLFSRFGPYSIERLYDAYFDLHQRYGPIIKLDMGISYVSLFEAEDVQKLFNQQEPFPKRPLFEALRHYRLKNKHLFNSAGLITENGPDWWELRKAVNFMMKPSFAIQYFPAQLKIAEDFVNRIRFQRTANFEVRDFLKELYRYTEETVGQVCFGTRLGLMDLSDCNADSVSSKLTAAADDTLESLADSLLSLPLWKVFKTKTYKKLVRSQEFFREFALECLVKAKEKAKVDEHKNDPTLQFLLQLTENPKLDDKDVALLMTEIFSAGIDATGNSIGFLLYNLAKNPEVQEKLYSEISAIVSSEQSLQPETFQSIPYLRACIKESHRLTPTAGGIARIFDSPTEFCGYQIPANVLCIGINPVIGKQNRYFKDPEHFKPERWLNEKRDETPHPFCVMPFSHGVRRCVGQRFAEQEIFLCIIKMIQNFRVEYNGPDIGGKMRLQITPDHPLNFKFIDR